MNSQIIKTASKVKLILTITNLKQDILLYFTFEIIFLWYFCLFETLNSKGESHKHNK